MCSAERHLCFTLKVARWNPDTGEVTPLFDGPAGLIAGASVGLRVGNMLYIGSYSGDRILKVSLDAH
jgi:hypothetical protein